MLGFKLNHVAKRGPKCKPALWKLRKLRTNKFISYIITNNVYHTTFLKPVLKHHIALLSYFGEKCLCYIGTLPYMTRTYSSTVCRHNHNTIHDSQHHRNKIQHWFRDHASIELGIFFLNCYLTSAPDVAFMVRYRFHLTATSNDRHGVSN